MDNEDVLKNILASIFLISMLVICIVVAVKRRD